MASNISPPSTTVAKKMVNSEAIQKAVRALLKWKKLQISETDKPESLFGSDDFMYLLLTLKKIPRKDNQNTFKIPLVHPLQESLHSYEVCLVIDDRPKSNPKFKLTAEAALKKIKSEDIAITKVVKFSKLKSDYRSFEEKRKLNDSFDLFFADKRVVQFLPKLLGKQFYKKKKKVPVPVDLEHCNWKEQIESASSSVLLCLSSGTCSVIKIGKSSMERKEIVENVVKVIDEVVEVVPRKWGGVRSFHLKFTESLALPIYQALPDMKMKIEGTKEDVELKEKVKKGEGKIDEKLKSFKQGRINMDPKVDEENEREIEELGSAEFMGKEADVMISRSKSKSVQNDDVWIEAEVCLS